MTHARNQPTDPATETPFPITKDRPRTKGGTKNKLRKPFNSFNSPVLMNLKWRDREHKLGSQQYRTQEAMQL